MDLSERPAGEFRRHPWEIARARFLRAVVRDYGRKEVGSVLDVGAGDGWFSQQLLSDLTASARITCWDAEYTPESLETLNAREPGRITYVAKQPSGAFDLVVMLDVLEHVEHDRDFLARLARENFGPSTTVLFTVPAWQGLYTSHDARLRHHRRYSPRSGATVLESAGLRIVASGGMFHSLLLPRTLQRAREALVPPRDARDAKPETLEWRHGAVVTRAVDAALAVDNAASHLGARMGVSLPGLSWWAVCRRA